MDLSSWYITDHAIERFQEPSRFGDARHVRASAALQEALRGPHYVLGYDRKVVRVATVWDGRWMKLYLDPESRKLVTVYRVLPGELARVPRQALLTEEWLEQYMTWSKYARLVVGRTAPEESASEEHPIREAPRYGGLSVPIGDLLDCASR